MDWVGKGREEKGRGHSFIHLEMFDAVAMI